jgi:hypothetical protein
VDRLSYSSTVTKQPLSRPADESPESPLLVAAVKYSPSDQMRKIIEEARAEKLKRPSEKTAQAGNVPNSAAQGKYEAMLSILEALMRRLTGKNFKAMPIVRLTAERPASQDIAAQQANAGAAQPTAAQQAAAYTGAGAGGSVELRFIESSRPKTLQITDSKLEVSHYEKETLSYSAQGLVRTADGRSISIDVSLNMSREFAAAFSQEIQTAKVKVDPLIINFSGGSASLTSAKYEFDLDIDGSADQISFVGEGSGFLALDRNGDGRVNDGSELFGPATGSGFGELRSYDSDRNGWIDENDDVFSKLLVWTKDDQGADLLVSLKEADVGAIFLGDLRTEYSLGGYSGASDGTLRSTSVFLRESGGAGTVQHVDLSV